MSLETSKTKEKVKKSRKGIDKSADLLEGVSDIGSVKLAQKYLNNQKLVEQTLEQYAVALASKKPLQIIDPLTNEEIEIHQMKEQYDEIKKKIETGAGGEVSIKHNIAKDNTSTVTLTGLKKGERAYIFFPYRQGNGEYYQTITNNQPIECYTQYDIVIMSKDGISCKGFLSGGKPIREDDPIWNLETIQLY